MVRDGLHARVRLTRTDGKARRTEKGEDESYMQKYRRKLENSILTNLLIFIDKFGSCRSWYQPLTGLVRLAMIAPGSGQQRHA
jgi:hypothetical protein